DSGRDAVAKVTQGINRKPEYTRVPDVGAHARPDAADLSKRRELSIGLCIPERRAVEDVTFIEEGVLAAELRGVEGGWGVRGRHRVNPDFVEAATPMTGVERRVNQRLLCDVPLGTQPKIRDECRQLFVLFDELAANIRARLLQKSSDVVAEAPGSDAVVERVDATFRAG